MEHSKLRFVSPLGRPNSGVALVLVLLLVVLTTVMILAFFLSVQTESKSVRSVVSGQNSRQLADIAVQSVIAQIQQATTQGTRVAWASQPGMIRTYNTANNGSTGSGTALNWYKLYSSASSIAANPTESLTTLTNDLPSQAWATPGSPNYGVYTDINSPVYSADGTLTYPIVNPAGATSTAAATNTILGFDIAATNTPGYSSGSPASPVNNPAAMPVLWIYVLRDGTQVPAAASSTPGTVSVPGASSSNPIVGRIAYWTDDETCKLNVNTAGNGTYFDTPRFGAVESPPASNAYMLNSGLAALTPAQRDAQRLVDQQMALSPPVANEYQRYIGHPSQTQLSYAFPNSPSTALGALDLGSLSQIFSKISPFMQWGGSEAGLYTEWDTVPPLFPPQRQTPYATLDEWMFNTQLNASSPATRLLNTDLNSNPIVTNTSLQQLRFFLSANSDAPEVNLFGQPRICIWPINNDLNLVTKPNSPYATTTDTQIARASSLLPTSGGVTTQYPYYFARYDSTSNTHDYSNIPRNISIYKFLETMAGKSIPGYGGTFTGKYSAAEMNQILTEIFDYIRCTDPMDTLLTSTYQYSQASLRYLNNYGEVNGEAGSGQVVPISITPAGASYSTKGFGRFYSLAELSIDFTKSQTNAPPAGMTDSTNEIVTGVVYPHLYCPSLGAPDMLPDMRIEIDGLNQWTINTTPAPAGNPGNTNTYVFGACSTSADANPTRTVYSVIPETPPNNASAQTWWKSDDWHDNPPNYWFLWGGATGPRQFVIYKNSSYYDLANTGAATAPLPTPTPQAGNYMFCGQPLKIPVGSTIHFSGGPLTIKISWGGFNVTHSPGYWTGGDGYPGTATDLVQTISCQVPAFDAPAPTNSPGSGSGYNIDLSSRMYNAIYGPSSGSRSDPIMSGDTVRSVIAGYNGDARLIAAQANVTSLSNTTNTASVATDTMTNAFVYFPTPSNVTTVHMQRDIFVSDNMQLTGASSPGPLLTGSGISYAKATFNGYVGDHATTGTTATSPDGNGDWDNGIGAFPDGPYINRADEGAYQYANYGGSAGNSPIPYYQGNDSSLAQAQVYTSPNRTVASPVTFGSLSTGVPIPNASPAVHAVPWRTLLFRPQPTHFGATSPEDELLLDWFWMPVVDPYAISTTFATAGKVNLNYQIAPFTYITRATALMGVLASEYVITVPNSAAGVYKTGWVNPATPYRQPVRLVGSDGRTIDYSTGTLGQFNQRFNNGEIFKSAAEICDINLVPNPTPTASTGAFDPTSASAVATYWANNALTGDNSRERPYNGLYPRLTTKSNTYTVHVRAQTLTSPSNLPAGEWVENPQLITSEYRGSVTINRYLDPQDPNIPDMMASVLSYSLDSYYKYRVLETRRFLP